MTYSKPEAISNQSSLVKNILQQGFAAAQSGDWLEVSNQLKQLPQSKTNNNGREFLLERKNWQRGFDLALRMLIQADFQHKWAISKILPGFGNQVITPLSALVIDITVDPEVRWFICQILGNFLEPEVVLVLVKLLQQTTDQELVSIASKTLIKIAQKPNGKASQSAVNAIVDLLSQPEYRALAVESLSYIRTAETINPLLKVATDRDPGLRAIAIKALSSFKDSRIPSVLLNALQDRASIVRKEAAISLGYRPELCHELSLVSYLQPLLKDHNLEVCCLTAVSLGRMQQETANAALYEVLQANNTPIMLKSEIVKALGWSEISSGIDYLQQALTTANEVITQEIITILGRISSLELKSQASNVLIDFWQHNCQLCTPQTRQILATSLGELGDCEALKDLLRSTSPKDSPPKESLTRSLKDTPVDKRSAYFMHPRRHCSSQTILEQLALDSDRKVKLHALAALRKLSSPSK